MYLYWSWVQYLKILVYLTLANWTILAKTHLYNFKCSAKASWTTGFYKQASICYTRKILILEYFIGHETSVHFPERERLKFLNAYVSDHSGHFFLISTPAYSKHTLSKIHKWSLCLSPTCIWAFPYLFFIIQANLWNVNWPNAHQPKIMRRWISTSAFRCVSSRSRLFFSSMHPLCGQQNHITLTATERQFI